jgi:serine/threonine protein kinase
MNQDISEQNTEEHIVSNALAETIASVEANCPFCGVCHGCQALDPNGHEQLAVCIGCRASYFTGPALPKGHELVRELGRGGMGAVYLTKIEGQEKAVKVLLPKLATSAERRALFLQEASIHRQLRHPKIVALEELCEIVPGVFCMVMEYVPGVNASSLLEKGPLSVQDAVELVSQALEGLDYVHQQGFLHRDIKDPNLLVIAPELQRNSPPKNSLKISDFGLAVPYALLGKNRDQEDVTTNTSGTLPYMAPETFAIHQPSPQIDLYAMGATLYRFLTNEFPHDFPAGKSKIPIVATQPPVPIVKRRQDLPESLVSIVNRSLAKDPKERFQSAEEMRQALRSSGPKT